MDSPVEITCLFIVMPMLALSLLLIFIRLAKGPTLLDRVIASDLLVTTSIAVILTFSVLFSEENLVDVIVVLAVLMFLNTVAFAYYYEKKG